MTARKILVVEDDDALRDMLIEVLGKAGFQVANARDGIEAMVMISSYGFDLVITDLKMPNLDGNELYLSVVQKNPHMRNKFLFISGNFNDLIFKKASSGAKRYLPKPFKVTELLAYVHMILDEIRPAALDSHGARAAESADINITKDS